MFSDYLVAVLAKAPTTNKSYLWRNKQPILAQTGKHSKEDDLFLLLVPFFCTSELPDF
jgi:hypothetical protein